MSKTRFAKKPPPPKAPIYAKKPTSRAASEAKSSTSEAKPKPKEEPKEYKLPAFSVPYRPKVTESELDKLRKKTIRRNAPPGEDLKGIKAILKSLKDQDIKVQEFISLIGPSTGDNGETLRLVMIEDLNAFRKLARKVYETITQDNSDVLLNEQLQVSEYYKEKKNLLNDKMMRIIEEIYSYVPNFDFDKYATEKQKYLDKVLPLPDELKIEPEEIEMMKRQAAYHRLQWLRSEGDRLNEENNSLKKRLTQMKRLHVQEQMKVSDMEKEAEAKKQQLEAQEAEKRETLDILNDSLEKTIIAQEKSIRVKKDTAAKKGEPPQSKGAVPKKKKSKTTIKKRRRPAWNEEAAFEMEEQTINETRQSERSKVREAFHFSPIKTPPQKPTVRERSPFHFSPVKSPVGAQYVSPVPLAAMAPAPVAPPVVQRPPEPRGRRAQAPRDSWGGFY